MLLFIPGFFFMSSAEYNIDDVVSYAQKYWETPNHECGDYIDCTPWSYWGTSYCGYASHGGDCANFVSQCILEGGHKDLNQGDGICRGYPCGREEIGADKLQKCLKTYHGWTDLGIGYMLPPPPEIRPGDVLMYSNEYGTGTHATVVVRVTDGVAYIAAHSSSQYDRIYTYLTDSEHCYYRWLHNPGGSVNDTDNAPPVGRLETVDCQILRGWAQDRNDDQRSIEVQLYIGGQKGSSGAVMVHLTANESRQYLCDLRGYCSLGFSLPTPYSLMDNTEHVIYAYGLDTRDSTAVLLNGCPATITCAPEIPAGVKRAIISEQSRKELWRFDNFQDRIPVNDSILNSIKEGPDWEERPQLVRTDGDSLWILDKGFLRHVSDSSIKNWRFGGLIPETTWTAEEIASVVKGPSFRARPCIVAGSDSVYYMIDDSLSQVSSSVSDRSRRKSITFTSAKPVEEFIICDIKGRIITRFSGNSMSTGSDLNRIRTRGKVGPGVYLVVGKTREKRDVKKWVLEK